MPRELTNAGIAGIGTCVPDRVLTNAELEKMLVDTTDEWIRSSTGIRERRIASPEQATSDLAAAAAERALADAGIRAEEVDLHRRHQHSRHVFPRHRLPGPGPDRG